MASHRVPDADGGHHYEPCDAADYINSLEAEVERLNGLLDEIHQPARFLVNELNGSMPLCEVALREEMGNTNYHCLEQRRDELAAILARRNCRPEPDNDDNTPEAAGTGGP